MFRIRILVLALIAAKGNAFVLAPPETSVSVRSRGTVVRPAVSGMALSDVGSTLVAYSEDLPDPSIPVRAPRLCHDDDSGDLPWLPRRGLYINAAEHLGRRRRRRQGRRRVCTPSPRTNGPSPRLLPQKITSLVVTTISSIHYILSGGYLLAMRSLPPQTLLTMTIGASSQTREYRDGRRLRCFSNRCLVAHRA